MKCFRKLHHSESSGGISKRHVSVEESLISESMAATQLMVKKLKISWKQVGIVMEFSRNQTGKKRAEILLKSSS